MKAIYGRIGTWIDEQPAQALILILVLMLCLGILKLRIDPPSPDFNWENRWWQIALNVERGQGYVSCKPLYFPFCGPTNQLTAMREPLPVLFFAILARLSNESLLVAAASGVVVNFAVLVAVYALTRELAEPRVAIFAALLWAFYLAPIRFFYSQVSGDLLATLGLTCGLIFYLRARRTGQGMDWLAAGILTGLAILSRSAVLIVALALTAGLFLWPYEGMTRFLPARLPNLRPMVLYAVGWLAILLPWLVRNQIAFQRPVIGSTLAGYYLYRQNYILPTDHYLRFVSGGEFEPVLQELLARRPDLRGTENEAEMDQVYRSEALQIIRDRPFRYLSLSIYRFFMLWFNLNVNEVYGKPDTIGDRIVVVQHALLLGVGTLGLYLFRRCAWPLALSIIGFSLVYMAVMAHMLYVVPVVPLLVAPSAMALGKLQKAILTP